MDLVEVEPRLRPFLLIWPQQPKGCWSSRPVADRPRRMITWRRAYEQEQDRASQ